uniref:Gustatory receptor n=1 Tax=Anopheles funestus TaxID=62324 RepID=A0A182S4Y7_ANOFN
MKWFTANSVFDSIKPAYRAGRAIGIFTHTVDFQRHELSKRAQDQVLLVVAILMDVYALTVSFRTEFSISDSILLNVGIYSSVNLGICISLCITLCNRIVGRRMFRIYETLNQVDNILLSFDYRMNHSFNHMLCCFYTVSPIVANALMMLSTFFISDDRTSQQFGSPEIAVFLRTSLVFMVFGSYIFLTITSISTRFRGLNEVICKVFPTSKSSDPHKTKDREAMDVVATVRCFGDVHEKLSEAVIDFNYCFALQILLMMASAFGYTLFSFFGIIHTLSHPEVEQSQQVSMNNMVYGCIYLSFIIQVVVAGSMATHQCKRTAIFVHKVVCYGTYELSILRQLKFLSHQLRQTAPKVSCLLYDFEWPFLVSVAATLFMHVIILVQFDLSIIANKV